MPAAGREIVFSRVFDAPRELVFKAWTSPEHVVQWWGPRGFTTTTHEINVRSGGVWRFTMHGPDGTDYENRIDYDEVVEPERIVYAHRGEGDDKDVSFQTTVTFADQGGKTHLTMRALFPSAEERERVVREYHADEGGRETLDRLGEFLGSDAMNDDTMNDNVLNDTAQPQERDIVIVRVFAAPRELVFEAWTKPEHLVRWWAPKGCTTQVRRLDLRPGGSFHFCMRTPDGKNIWGLGIYRDIVVPERIVYTDTFADADGNPVPPTHYGMSAGHPAETLVTVTFAEHDGGTLLTLRHAIPESVVERGATQQGWGEMLERLAEALAPQ